MLLFLLTFIVNWSILVYFLFVISLFKPLKLTYIIQTLQYCNIKPIYDYQIFCLAFIIMLAAALLGLFKPLNRIQLWLLGSRKPSDIERASLQPAIDILAKHTNLNLSKVSFFVNRDNQANAFAMGSSYITVFTPLFEILNDDELAAILAHELGHLKLNHTVYGAVIYSMNYLTQCFIYIYILLSRIITAVLSAFPITRIIAYLIVAIINIQVFVLNFLVHLPIKFIMLFSSRGDEYAADAFAAKAGLGLPLANALLKLEECTGYNSMKLSFLQNLGADHPSTEKRIKRLKKISDELHYAEN